jgi:glycosyltransferase involved in cell wall biosynthesis
MKSPTDSRPFLSVIIITYNRAELVRRALASIRFSPTNVPEHGLEVIVVDDGDDGTDAVVERFHRDRKDIMCKYVRPKQRISLNHARNEGIDNANGKWFNFLDSDDEFVENGLDSILTTLRSAPTKADAIAFSTLREIDGVMKPMGFRVGRQWDTHWPSYEEVVFKADITGDMNYCFKRDIFEWGLRFPDDIQGFESFLLAGLVKRGARVLYVNKLADRRYTGKYDHVGSYLKWPRQYARYYLKFADEHKKLLNERPRQLAYYYRSAGTSYMRAGDMRGLWWLFRAVLCRLGFCH